MRVNSVCPALCPSLFPFCVTHLPETGGIFLVVTVSRRFLIAQARPFYSEDILPNQHANFDWYT